MDKKESLEGRSMIEVLIRPFRGSIIITAMSIVLSWAVLSDTQARDKIHTIGVVMDDSSFDQELKGFKTGMAEKGYVEGRDIRYISLGFTGDDKAVGIDKKYLVNNDMDMIVAMGNDAALWADSIAKGTDISVLFCMISSDPVAEGMVKTLSRPDGNVTGIRVADSLPKALEWLKRVVPDLKKVYLPYNPLEEISVLAVNGIDNAATLLGLEIVPHRISSSEEVLSAIENMQQDIDAIFWVPSFMLESRYSELGLAAIKNKIPTGAAFLVEESVLVTFSPDYYKSGLQTARMAQQVLMGISPGDIPVETSEVMLIVNLKTAREIGVEISNDVLSQANGIIR